VTFFVICVQSFLVLAERRTPHACRVWHVSKQSR